MFETLHFIWLGLCFAVIVGGAIYAKYKKFSLTTALTVLCACAIASELVKIFCVLIENQRVNEYGVFIKETDLPFHLCSMQIIFAFVARLTKNNKTRECVVQFMIPTAALGGFAALMIPTITCRFTNVRTYQYFLYHAALIWFAVVAIMSGEVKLDFKAFRNTLVILLGLVWVTFYINGMFQNTNFLYLSEPPMDGLPILNMDNGWLVYFLSYMALALTLIALFFVPFWIRNAKQRRCCGNCKSCQTETTEQPQEN